MTRLKQLAYIMVISLGALDTAYADFFLPRGNHLSSCSNCEGFLRPDNNIHYSCTCRKIDGSEKRSTLVYPAGRDGLIYVQNQDGQLVDKNPN